MKKMIRRKQADLIYYILQRAALISCENYNSSTLPCSYSLLPSIWQRSKQLDDSSDESESEKSVTPLHSESSDPLLPHFEEVEENVCVENIVNLGDDDFYALIRANESD